MPELTDKQFIEAVYELAFGHDAINRNFGHAEVIEQLEEFNEDSLKWDSIPDDDKKEQEDAFYSIEPTDQEMMYSFGTKWHDAL